MRFSEVVKQAGALLRDSGRVTYRTLKREFALDDEALPTATDGVYLGGGFPELYASALAANHGMRVAVREYARRQRPIYAE